MEPAARDQGARIATTTGAVVISSFSAHALKKQREQCGVGSHERSRRATAPSASFRCEPSACLATPSRWRVSCCSCSPSPLLGELVVEKLASYLGYCRVVPQIARWPSGRGATEEGGMPVAPEIMRTLKPAALTRIPVKRLRLFCGQNCDVQARCRCSADLND